MAAGDVVNTAARLQSAAPVNGILVGETTYRATSERSSTARPEPVAAKGKAEPIARLGGGARHARASVWTSREARTPLVGRERELDAARATRSTRVRRERAPQLVTLVGVPGIGKSRLVAELFQRRRGGAGAHLWRQGRSLPYGEGVSFWALGEIVKAQAGILESDSADEASRQAACAPPRSPTRRGRLGLAPPSSRSSGSADGSRPTTGARAFAAWRRFLEGLAEQRPLVLVFEDLHWADDGLLDFVDHLVEWATGVPLLVVGTARPELLERRPGWGGGKLERRDVLARAARRRGDGTADLWRCSTGRSCRPRRRRRCSSARAAIRCTPSSTRACSPSAARARPALPETVQGIIAARLDGLPPSEKRLLQDAAVLGKVFWSGGVVGARRVDGDAIAEMRSTRSSARSSSGASGARRSGEDEYSFRHVLVRDVAYGQIPRPRAPRSTSLPPVDRVARPPRGPRRDARAPLPDRARAGARLRKRDTGARRASALHAA